MLSAFLFLSRLPPSIYLLQCVSGAFPIAPHYSLYGLRWPCCVPSTQIFGVCLGLWFGVPTSVDVA